MGLFTVLLLVLLAYTCQPTPRLPRWFVGFFAMLDVLYLATLYSQVLEQPLDAPAELNQWVRAADAVSLALHLSQSKLGFSRDIIERAEAILAPLEAGRTIPASAWGQPLARSGAKPRTSATDRSILDNLSFDWPDRTLRSDFALEDRRNSARPSRPERPSSSFHRLHTTSKASAGFKTEPKERTLSVHEINEADQRLATVLAQRGVNPRLFYIWAEERMQRWFALTLAPEIIRRNLTNLKEINEVLLPFGATLKEHSAFERVVEVSRGAVGYAVPPNSALRSVSLDDLLSLDLESVQQWGSVLQISPETAPKVPDALHQLSGLIAQRVTLDKYLCPKDYRVEIARLFCFKALLQCQREGVPASEPPHDSRRRFPGLAETLLNAFVSCVTEFNPSYASVPFARDRIFIEDYLGLREKDEAQFLVETGSRGKLTCFSGPAFVSFPATPAGSFSAMTFFAYHVKHVQKAALRKQMPSAFNTLFSEFDVKNDLN